jgi:uncharacterized protein (DUF885 family)
MDEAAGTGGDDVSRTLATLCQDVWTWRLDESPFFATYLGVGTHDRIDERGPAARERRERALDAFLRRLEAIPPDGLVGEDRLTRAILLRTLSEETEAFRHHGWEWDLDQLAGLHIGLQDILNVQPLAQPEDVERLLARYAAAPAAFEQWTVDLRAGLSSGRVAPRTSYERVRAQVRGVVEAPPAKTSFVTVADRLPALWSFAEKKRVRTRLLEAAERHVLPAYRSFLAFLDGEYAGKARKDVGVWSIPGGVEAYSFLVRQSTTTRRTPEALHELGKAELEKNRRDMLAIAKADGHDGDLRAYLDALGRDPRFRLDSREAVLDRYRAVCRRMDARLPEVFGLLPRTAYEVRPLEEYREKDAPAAYYQPPADDGSRGGIFYANTHDPSSWPTYEMEALCHHEATPGHHLQIAIAQERRELPALRRHAGFTAYVEGWAHYTELLADEMGAYSTPHDRLGYLAAQAWRAARLVVDTGMHALKWSREKAVALLREVRSGPESDLENEVDRYVIWPGQALAYKVGQRTILDVRERARKRLGDRFSLRAFHDEVLRHGALPLSLLEDLLHAWDGAPAPSPT